tara:strand:- start:1904 stop:2800 length:897 start_codon:yes stop_codon:yes gene_type:complete
MMKRILKRPMFRMGGDVENVGIMDGMRKRYANGTNPQDIDATYNAAGANFKPTNENTMSPRLPMDSKLAQKMALINQLAPGPNLNQFLIDFGLNLASKSPTGNIFSTAAGAAREPFGRFMEQSQRSGQTKAALALEALDDKDLDSIEELVPYYMDVYNIDEEGAKKMILEDKRFSKSGKLDPTVAKNQKIEKRASTLLDSQGFDLGYDGAIQISTAIENVVTGRNPNVSKDDIDLTQIYIDPDVLGAEDQESGVISLTENKGNYTEGEYQNGLKYYHPIKGKFYTFQGEKFIPVEPAQ